MSRKTGVFKTPPTFFNNSIVEGKYAKISKAAWADLYADLYRQINGEQITPEEIIKDAENRLSILKQNGIR